MSVRRSCFLLTLTKHFTIFNCFLVLVFAGQAFSDQGPCVEVLSISGAVEVCRTSETEYKKAIDDMLLQSGDKIKTSQDSYIELAFDENDSNVVRIEENTSAVLLLKEGEKIDLLEGRVFAIVSNLPSGSSFEIRTPTAISGVRGTDWVTEVKENDTTVEAIEGSPYVSGIGADGKPMAEQTLVLPGYTTRVKRFQRPSALVRIPEERYLKWKATRIKVRERAQEVFKRRRLLRKPFKQDIKQDIKQDVIKDIRQNRIRNIKRTPKIPR